MLNKSNLIISSLFFSTYLTGCSTLSGAVTTDLKNPEIRLEAANAFVPAADAQKFGITPNSDGTINYGTLDGLIAYTAVSGSTKQQKALGTLLIKASDESCYEYLTKISTNEKTTKSALGVTALLLSGAASVTTPVRNANLLSALSTTSQGVEDELSNSILGGQDGDLLVQAVRKGRETERQNMADLLEGSSKVTANFNRFLIEFPTYHDSCGVSYGRQVLRNAVNDAGSSN